MSPSTEFTTQGSMGVILGLDTRTIRSPESHVPQDGDGVVYTFMKEGDSVVDMKQRFESLYVYTNVVESRTALRIVPIQGEHGQRSRDISSTFSTCPCCARSLEQSKSI